MRLLFSILSIAYIAVIFLWAGSPIVSDLTPFNPYGLLHIPLYGILTILLILLFFPLRLKGNALNAHNASDDPDIFNESNPSTHLRIRSSPPLRFMIVGLIALGVGIADEIHQSFIPTRDASILDVFFDFAGIILVLFLVYRFAKGKYFFGFKSITDSMSK